MFLLRRRGFSSAAHTVVVYTDGACKHNGVSARATAGIGVFFSKGDERNVSASLPGTAQTNQRAELAAAIAALERVADDAAVEIRSDSRYVVEGVGAWLPQWRRNGFVSSKRTPVANVDLWLRIDRLLAERRRLQRATSFVHVRAHRGVDGNEQADQLAVAGANERTEMKN